MSWLSRFANAFRPSSVDRALDEEAAFHLECRINELVAGGLSPKEAEVHARRAFGNRIRLREESRDVKLLPWLVDGVQDVRVAARVLRAAPIVTGVAILLGGKMNAEIESAAARAGVPEAKHHGEKDAEE